MSGSRTNLYRTLPPPTSPSPSPSHSPSRHPSRTTRRPSTGPAVVIKREYFSDDEFEDEDEEEDELDDSDDESIILLGFGGGVKRELDDTDDEQPEVGRKVLKLTNGAGPRGSGSGSGGGRGRGRPRKSGTASATALQRRKSSNGGTARAPRTGGPGKRWTGAEVDALFRSAVGDATPTKFRGAVPGRSELQCYHTWR